VTTRLKKFRKQDYLHFVPACIGFLLLMPFFILSGPEKIDAILSHKPTYYEILGEVFYFASIIQGVIYCSLSIKYIREYHKKVKENFSNIEARTLYWLQTILTIVLVILILGPLASSVLHNQFSQYIFNVLYITIGSSIYITSFYMLTQNSLFVENYFTDYPIVGNIDPKQDSNDQSEVLIEEEVLNLSNFQLDHDYSMSIIQKLETTMRQENLYLYHDLSLNTVAQKIKIPRHHISHVLNKMLNTNFFDYINKYRVDEAKRKIEDESLSNYTLIALGLEAGFNSKASFYRNFRKYENMTPLEYKQMIDKQSNKM
jgi:AraC-like DNA-binding protein